MKNSELLTYVITFLFIWEFTVIMLDTIFWDRAWALVNIWPGPEMSILGQSESSVRMLLFKLAGIYILDF